MTGIATKDRDSLSHSVFSNTPQNLFPILFQADSNRSVITTKTLNMNVLLRSWVKKTYGKFKGHINNGPLYDI